MTQNQIHDLFSYIVEEMSFNPNRTIDYISLWGEVEVNTTPSFMSYSQEVKDLVRQMMYECMTLLWSFFNSKNMFDPMLADNLSFPFVIHNIGGNLVVFAKDNVISTNSVNIYGKPTK